VFWPLLLNQKRLTGKAIWHLRYKQVMSFANNDENDRVS